MQAHCRTPLQRHTASVNEDRQEVNSSTEALPLNPKDPIVFWRAVISAIAARTAEYPKHMILSDGLDGIVPENRSGYASSGYEI